MIQRELLARARRSIASARLLLDSGDTNGACNRAYYAMFDAARAALLASNEPPKSEAIKTHGGLISAFSQQLVKPGHVSIELGKSLGQMVQLRLVADYSDEEIDRDAADRAIARAAIFVEAMSSR
jgi:uncharacterized protein (UPF0332 family)